MMKEPLISICIPAYNHEKFINNTISSVISQSYSNLELIIIDDGSSDKTLEKIKELEPLCKTRFKRYYFAHQKNLGTCLTLNKLISLSQGDFIFILASDDIVKPNTIKILANFLIKNNQYVLAVGDNEIIDSNSKRVGWSSDRYIVNLHEATYRTFGEFLQKKHYDINFDSNSFGEYKTLIKSNYIPNGYLISANALNKIHPFTNDAPLEDWFLMLQLSKLGKFKYFNSILFSYRWHSKNSIKNTDKIKRMSIMTQQYEKKLVSSLPDSNWNDIFDHQTKQLKIKCKIGSYFKIYKKRDVFNYKYIIEIFKLKIILKQKDFLPNKIKYLKLFK